jgi:hypothetical protein
MPQIRGAPLSHAAGLSENKRCNREKYEQSRNTPKRSLHKNAPWCRDQKPAPIKSELK